MKLNELLKNLPFYQKYDKLNPQIKGISEDSGKIKKGFLFVALRGFTVDGHDFIKQAISKGAVAVVGEKDVNKLNIPEGVSYTKVKNARDILGILASQYYNNPSRKMKIIAVTGSDGKTTTATLIHHVLTKSGFRVGLVTSVSAKIGKSEYDTGFHVTSPDPIVLQKFLKKMADSNCKYAVLEVTSHGLDQERVGGIDFEIGVLTNITREHLDYHKTYDKYLRAKVKLFNRSKYAILNNKDKSYDKVKNLIKKNVETMSYDIEKLPIQVKKAVKSRFTQIYNQFNAAAAYTVLHKLGISDSKYIEAISGFTGIPGRLEEIQNNKGLKIYIDFAHTPNALLSVLTELKKNIKTDKLISIFGCASERDDSKRRIMGEISCKIADYSIFTAEDPRHEDINKILDEIEIGAKKTNAKLSEVDKMREQKLKGNEHFYFKIPERGEAIYYAINNLAKNGDTLVICGKGHEKSMAYNGIEYPWSDKKAINSALKGKILEIKHK